MAFELKDNQIFLHKNLKAEGRQPVMKGSLMIGGQAYEIALWGSASGKEGSYSGKVSLPFKPSHQAAQAVETTPELDAMDQDVPF